MNCDKAIKTYLKLDNGQSLPFTLQVHMLRCYSCRKFINTYQDSLLQLLESKHSQTKVDFTDAIMNEIYTLDIPQLHVAKVSNFKWIIAGLFIIAGFICIPFSEYFNTLINYFGTHLELPLSIVMGCIVTVYSAMFVITHTSIFNSKVIEKFFQKN